MGQGNMIGYEITEKMCQISYYNDQQSEPETLEVDSDNYQIPLLIGRLRDTWAYGKEAKRLVTIKEGFVVTRLLERSLAGEKIDCGEETYDAVELLSKFIQLSLQQFPVIDGIVFSVPELTESWLRCSAGSRCGWGWKSSIFLFRITRKASAITCSISPRNSGSMTRRCSAVTGTRSRHLCSGV